MRKSWIVLILLSIFIIVSGIRIYYAFETTYFSDNDAYFALRQVEYIKEHFVPLYNDPLSFGGRVYVFLPLFHYILAIFAKIFSPIVIAKVLPNLFASTIVFAVYLLVQDITKNEEIAIFTSIFSAFIPVYFYTTLNTISVYSVVIPLTVLLLYLFINIEQETNLKYFLLAIVLFMLTHTSVILLILSLIVYLILIKIEDFKLNRSEVEITLFSAFIMLWMYLLIFKKAFLKHGLSFIWQNMPIKYAAAYFHQISIWQAIYQIGIIPFILGIFIIYYYLFNLKDKKVYLLISFVMTTTILLWLRLIKLELALIYLSVMLVILFGIAYHHLNNYIRTTKFSKLETPLFVLICIVFVLTSILPSISLANRSVEESTKPSLIDDLIKIKELTPNDARIGAPINDGHLIAYFAQRKNFGDTNFLFLDDANEVVKDIDELYTTISKIKASEILHKNGINYVLFTPNTKEEYSLEGLKFVDKECFTETELCVTTLYKNKCVIIKSMMAK